MRRLVGLCERRLAGRVGLVVADCAERFAVEHDLAELSEPLLVGHGVPDPVEPSAPHPVERVEQHPAGLGERFLAADSLRVLFAAAQLVVGFDPTPFGRDVPAAVESSELDFADRGEPDHAELDRGLHFSSFAPGASEPLQVVHDALGQAFDSPSRLDHVELDRVVLFVELLVDRVPHAAVDLVLASLVPTFDSGCHVIEFETGPIELHEYPDRPDRGIGVEFHFGVWHDLSRRQPFEHFQPLVSILVIDQS